MTPGEYGKPTCTFLTIFLFMFLSLSGANAANYVFSGNQLIGATQVEVNGANFTVSFVEGTAEDVWNLSGGGSFDFSTQAEAQAAAETLGEQVFDNQILVNYGTVQRWERDTYDTQPALTYGIGSYNRGDIVIPYAIDRVFFSAWAFINEASYGDLGYADSDFTGAFATSLTNDSSTPQNNNFVFAKFTLTPVPIPVPGTALLMGSGLLGILGTARRKRNG